MTAQESNEVGFGTTMCWRDIHYGRALLASINDFYPNHSIKVTCALDATRVERAELSRFPNVEVFGDGLVSARLIEQTRVPEKF